MKRRVGLSRSSGFAPPRKMACTGDREKSEDEDAFMAKTTTIKTETLVKVEKAPVAGSSSGGDGGETPIDTVIAILEDKKETEIAPAPKKPLLSGGIRKPLLSGSKPLLSGSSAASSSSSSSLLKKPLHSPSLAKPVVDENKTATLMTSLGCFEVMWCKQSKKKHKVYSDGLIHFLFSVLQPHLTPNTSFHGDPSVQKAFCLSRAKSARSRTPKERRSERQTRTAKVRWPHSRKENRSHSLPRKSRSSNHAASRTIYLAGSSKSNQSVCFPSSLFFF